MHERKKYIQGKTIYSTCIWATGKTNCEEYVIIVNSYCSWGFKGMVAMPSDAGVAGDIGVIGPPGFGVGGYKLAVFEGGITGFGVAPIPKLLMAGDIMGLCNTCTCNICDMENQSLCTENSLQLLWVQQCHTHVLNLWIVNFTFTHILF